MYDRGRRSGSGDCMRDTGDSRGSRVWSGRVYRKDSSGSCRGRGGSPIGLTIPGVGVGVWLDGVVLGSVVVGVVAVVNYSSGVRMIKRITGQRHQYMTVEVVQVVADGGVVSQERLRQVWGIFRTVATRKVCWCNETKQEDANGRYARCSQKRGANLDG